MMLKRRKYSLIAFVVIVMLAILIQYLLDWNISVVYPNFGIQIPRGYSTHGIDVSRYQKRINWKQVAAMRDKGQKISFAIIKATEGATMLDPYFIRNWKESKKAGLLRGAYLYFHPGNNPVSQATFFISKVKLEKGDLPPIVDIEETNGLSDEKIRSALKICLERLQEEYGVTPMIYTNVDFYEKRLGSEFNEYPLWAAHYERQGEPRINRTWQIWQHSDRGHVNGIDAKVDFNVVNGTIDVITELCL